MGIHQLENHQRHRNTRNILKNRLLQNGRDLRIQLGNRSHRMQLGNRSHGMRNMKHVPEEPPSLHPDLVQQCLAVLEHEGRAHPPSTPRGRWCAAVSSQKTRSAARPLHPRSIPLLRRTPPWKQQASVPEGHSTSSAPHHGCDAGLQLTDCCSCLHHERSRHSFLRLAELPVSRAANLGRWTALEPNAC